MVALIAYGIGSSVSILTSDSISLEIPSVLASEQQQIGTIGDPDFKPVWLKRQVLNISNNTTEPSNFTNNTSFTRMDNITN